MLFCANILHTDSNQEIPVSGRLFTIIGSADYIAFMIIYDLRRLKPSGKQWCLYTHIPYVETQML
jgi:hypothetical protein